MGTVIVATAAKVLEVEENSIVGGAVDESGHLILTNGAGDSIDAGSVAGTTPDASTTVKGIVELATNTEATTGTDTFRAITPAALAAVLSGYQAGDADLTAIAALAPTNDSIIQRKGGVWVGRTMAQLATDLIATGSFSGGGTTTYVPFKTVGPTGSGANYICDGTADNVEIQAALDSLGTTGGVVIVAPGTYTLAASITFVGADDYENGTRTLLGSGMRATTFVAPANIDPITITNAPSVNVANIGFKIVGTASAISAKMTTAGTHELYQSFMCSTFENIYVRRNGAGAHTGWAFKMGSAFRSRFTNIEVFDIHNGFQFYSENGAFNPGDFTVDRAFIELDNATGSVGLHISSPVANASMNQMTFNMVEFIDNATGGTAVLIDGVGEGNHSIFAGINIEQFSTLINVDAGTGNRFDLNYVECAAGGTFFKFGAASGGNKIRSVGMAFVGSKTNVFVNDANTWVDNPNSIEDAYIAVETGGVLNATMTSCTKVSGIRGYNSGTVNSRLGFQRFAWSPVPYTLTDGATINTDVEWSNHFRVTLAGNRTLAPPTNPRDGQKVTWEFIQDGTGSRTITLSTAAGGFAFGTDIPSVTLTTTASKRDFMGAIYNAAANKWHVVSLAKGY